MLPVVRVTEPQQPAGKENPALAPPSVNPLKVIGMFAPGPAFAKLAVPPASVSPPPPGMTPLISGLNDENTAVVVPSKALSAPPGNTSLCTVSGLALGMLSE